MAQGSSSFLCNPKSPPHHSDIKCALIFHPQKYMKKPSFFLLFCRISHIYPSSLSSPFRLSSNVGLFFLLYYDTVVRTAFLRKAFSLFHSFSLSLSHMPCTKKPSICVLYSALHSPMCCLSTKGVPTMQTRACSHFFAFGAKMYQISELYDGAPQRSVSAKGFFIQYICLTCLLRWASFFHLSPLPFLAS